MEDNVRGRRRERLRRKLKKICKGVVVALSVILLSLCLAAFMYLMVGRYRLYHTGGNVGGSSEASPKEDTVWPEEVTYQGVSYQYNDDILTFLLMGIDKEEEVERVESGISGGQSDAMFLIVLNPRSGELSIISIPRDTMTTIDYYDENGEFLISDLGQITLQHGYGDGAEISCERSVKAVSNLFYNLPIHGYCAINMGVIRILNNSIGGVSYPSVPPVVTKANVAAVMDAKDKFAALTGRNENDYEAPTLVAAFDVSVSEGQAGPEGTSYTVTVTLPGFTPEAGASYALLHLHNNVWSVIPATVNAGSVTFTTSEFSNFVLVKAGDPISEPEDEEPEDEEPVAADPTTPIASPKTGEAISVAGVLAVICVVGVVVCLRKETSSK